MIQSPYDSIFLFACLFFPPLSVTIKRVWLVQKGAGRTVPRSRAEKIRRQTAGEQWKKIKKREIEQKRKTEQKDEKRKKATNWNERIRTWKSSIRRMGRKELEAHIYRCHRKMKPGKMLPTYTLGILVQHQAKHAPKARRLGRRSVGVSQTTLEPLLQRDGSQKTWLFLIHLLDETRVAEARGRRSTIHEKKRLWGKNKEKKRSSDTRKERRRGQLRPKQQEKKWFLSTYK